MAPRSVSSARLRDSTADLLLAHAGKPLLAPGVDAAKAAATPYVPSDLPSREVPFVGQDYDGFLGSNFKELPLLQRLNWLHVPLLVVTPLIGLYGVATTPLDMRTLAFSVAYYFFSGLGITAGYHRLFAHRSYKAVPLMRAILLLMGAAAMEGSVRWYVDTPKDPYAIIKGFWHAHMGWMMVKQDKSKIGTAGISDLNADPLCRFQHKWYLPISLFMAFVLPTIIPGYFWGDYRGGYFYAAVARLVFVHHSTFFVNSLAHYAGSATYTDGHTARNSIITALVTLGEGYHNFHHEFPNDYRNGVEWWQYDPTKHFIWLLSLVGLTYDLHVFPENEISKGALQMAQKHLDAHKRAVNWGPDPATLRVLKRAEFDEAVARGAQWVLLDGFACDVGKWGEDHPGGKELVKSRVGKDITEEFKGGFYKHSNAGHNVAHTLRVARIEGYWAQ